MTVRASDLSTTIDAPNPAVSRARSTIRRITLPLVQAVLIVSR